MPAPGALTGTLIDTGNKIQDAADNIHQLVVEHKDDLKWQNDDLIEDMIVKYDEFKVYHTPFVSIVFDTARVEDIRINKCAQLKMDFILYYYYESLQFGNDTYPYYKPLYRLMEMFVVHPYLYNFCNGTDTGIVINSNSLIGRRLDSEAFLTGQLNITVPTRICRCGHE